MRSKVWAGLILGCALFVVSVAAAENVKFRVDVYKNGAQVTSATIATADKQTASLSFEGVSVAFTPTRVDDRILTVGLEVGFPGKETIKPQVTLVNHESGSLTFKNTSGGDLIQVYLTTDW